MSTCQSDGCYYYSQWWRRLVNAYEVKAGMVYLQCNNCVIQHLSASEVKFLEWGRGAILILYVFTFV